MKRSKNAALTNTVTMKTKYEKDFVRPVVMISCQPAFVFERKKIMNNTILLNEVAVRSSVATNLMPLTYAVAGLIARNDAKTRLEEPTTGVPIWEKYSLTVAEASEYYGIGEKRLRSIINENVNADFILEIGTHIRIKRKLFEDFLDQAMAV